MKTLILFLILCIVSNNVHSKTLELNTKEEMELTEFIDALAWGSQLGYVLYGEKPMLFEGFGVERDYAGKIFHHNALTFQRGLSVWKKLNLPTETEKFLFVITGDHLEGGIAFINKTTFKKVVEENLILFRALLSPEITADKLLKAFKDDPNLFSPVNHNKLLIGLLLGFGLENALYIAHAENLSEALLSLYYARMEGDRDEFFTSLVRRKIPNFSPINQGSLKPSIGYTCLTEELDTIEEKITVCSETLEKYSPSILFGIVENKSRSPLITNYENTQLEIIKQIDVPNLLEKVLSEFYGEPVAIKRTNNFDPPTPLKYPATLIVAQAIHDRLSDHCPELTPNEFEEFVKGMTQAAKDKDALYKAPYLRNRDFDETTNEIFREGFIVWSYYKNSPSLNLDNVIPNLTKIHHQGDQAKDIYPQLAKIHSEIYDQIKLKEKSALKKQGKTIAENTLYYQQLTAGKGPKIDPNANVFIAYTIKSQTGFILEQDKSWLDPQRTYKCFREILPQLSIGEKGILYAHPDWGFKDCLAPPHFSPQLVIEFEIFSQ